MTIPELHDLIDEWQAAATAAQAGRSTGAWDAAGKLLDRLARALAADGPLEHRGEVWEAVVSRVRVRPAQARPAAGGGRGG